MTKTTELPQMSETKAASLYSRTDLLKAMSEFFLDALPRDGYQEDHFFTDMRIIICMVCCGFGCYAQFMTKFPQDRSVIALCVCGYFMFSGILALIDGYFISFSVMCIKVNDQTVFIDVNIPTFSSEVTLTLRSREKKVSHKTSVGTYFDSKGYLRQEHLYGDFNMLMKKFEKDGSSKKDK